MPPIHYRDTKRQSQIDSSIKRRSSRIYRSTPQCVLESSQNRSRASFISRTCLCQDAFYGQDPCSFTSRNHSPGELNGYPAVLSDQEIERLQSSLRNWKATPFSFLRAGKQVRIRSGPFAGSEGKILRRKRENAVGCYAGRYPKRNAA